MRFVISADDEVHDFGRGLGTMLCALGVRFLAV